MPWNPEDASRFKRGIQSDRAKRKWASIANQALADGKSEGAAIRIANGVTRDSVRRRLDRGRARPITGA